ncbi:ABC transporter ATP-binding protein [Cereibacter changlensis]|uniref:ABC transporter ATP-binding protein n=1 Tax=Cereibacter changlensis TaxID=402884 RepID=A0A4U0Z4P2_9RHOB|nr:ABC transporter ATP-binding protein [Cereibacter changlensis]TKA97481.1 ABC transporter ATP-binding protein [Cereibacter changlensis]
MSLQAPEDRPLLEVDRLNTVFHTRAGTIRPVRNVSFTVARGEVLGVVGESGSGKSVTGLSILGLIDKPGEIESGAIRLNGRDLVGLPEAEMRRIRGAKIAMIFQNPMMTLNPLERIGYQIAEALSEHESLSRRELRERCVAALQAVGIPSPEERLDAYPHQFSGGMRQRIVIAAALVTGPDLIIADEPTTALDVTIQAQIIHQMRQLIDQIGAGMIWISHDLATLSELADRIVVMYAGTVVETGATAEIIGAPRHPYTRKLLDSVPSRNTPGAALAQIQGIMPSLLTIGEGCPFASRCDRRVDGCARPIPATKLSATRTVWCINMPEEETA